MIAEIDKLQEEITAEEKRLLSAISKELGEAFVEEIGEDLEQICDAAKSVNQSADKLMKQIDACDETAEKVRAVSACIEALPARIADAQTVITQFTERFEDMAAQTQNDVTRVLETNGQLTAALQTLLTGAEHSGTAAKTAADEMQKLYGQAAHICDEFIQLKRDNYQKLIETTDALSTCAAAVDLVRTSCEEAEKASGQYRDAAISGAEKIRQTSLEESGQIVHTIRTMTAQLSDALASYNAQLNAVSQDFSAAYQTLSEHCCITDTHVKKIEQALNEESARNEVRERESLKRFWIGAAIGGAVIAMQILQLILH